MKKVEEVLKENPNCHILTDKVTIDFELSHKVQLKESISKFICLRCANLSVDESNKSVLDKIKSSDTGIFIKCACGQNWFLHKPINIPIQLE